MTCINGGRTCTNDGRAYTNGGGRKEKKTKEADEADEAAAAAAAAAGGGEPRSMFEYGIKPTLVSDDARRTMPRALLLSFAARSPHLQSMYICTFSPP